MSIPDSVLDNVARCFSVLGEPTRLRILRSVCHGEKCVADIVAEVGSSQTNISRHLGVMYHSGVLGRRRDGSQVFYMIADPIFIEVCRTLCSKFLSKEEMALM
ncbi:MAG: DNA-binding transcriptional ArsR family regulator [Janthinobacterium sp.]|jgi:DNA-binding transcriptional ArsR family regulator